MNPIAYLLGPEAVSANLARASHRFRDFGGRGFTSCGKAIGNVTLSS